MWAGHGYCQITSISRYGMGPERGVCAVLSGVRGDEFWEEAAQKTRGRDGPAPSLIAMTNRATRWSWSPGNVQTAYLPTWI
jgi:hypothetical protein